MKIKANGIEFNCRIEGLEAAPWLILSNSLATNLTMWDLQAWELAGQFRGGRDVDPEPFQQMKPKFDRIINQIALFQGVDLNAAGRHQFHRVLTAALDRAIQFVQLVEPAEAEQRGVSLDVELKQQRCVRGLIEAGQQVGEKQLAVGIATPIASQKFRLRPE